MAAPLRSRAVPAAAATPDRRYWPLCLAVALLAMFMFYVTLQGLVRESAAHAAMQFDQAVAAARQAPVAPDMPRFEPIAPAIQVPAAAVAAVAAETLPPPAVVHAMAAAPAVVEVTKCFTPGGEAAYSDGPCPEGSQATKLRLPRDMNVAASL